MTYFKVQSSFLDVINLHFAIYYTKLQCFKLNFDFSPKTTTTNFEAVIKFSEYKIKDCHFHLSQSGYRKNSRVRTLWDLSLMLSLHYMNN